MINLFGRDGIGMKKATWTVFVSNAAIQSELLSSEEGLSWPLPVEKERE
jgi:hypothetical protein